MVALLAAALIARQTQAQFAAKVSFRQSYLSFVDFCASMSKQTGMKLAVRKDLEDRKLCINCKDRPSAEVLGKFAETFGGDWTAQGDTLRFDLKPAVRDEERIAIQSEAAWLKEDLTSFLQNLSSYPNPIIGRLGAVLAGHESEAIEALTEGRYFIGLSTPAPNALALPAEFFQPPIQGLGSVSLSYHPEHQIQMNIAKDNGISTYGDAIPPVSADKRTLKLEKRLAEWGAQNPQSMLTKAVKGPGDPPNKSYGVKGLSASDELIDLSDRSDLPVMGDGFRYQEFRYAWLGGDTVETWIAQFNKKRADNYETAYFRTSDGWVTYRAARYWKHLGQEIPERILEPLEDKQRSTGLSLDDYAGLCAAIDRNQATLIGTVLVHFATHPVRSNYNVLLFIAGLSKEQRSQIQTADYDVYSLSDDQRSDLREVACDSGGRPALLAALLLGRQSGTRPICRMDIHQGKSNDWQLPENENTPARVAQTVFVFAAGSGPTDNVIIWFRLPTAPG